MRRLRFVVALFAVFVTVLGVSSPGDRAEAQTRPAASLPDFSLPHAENTLLVGFQPGSKANERAAAARSAGVAAASAPVTPADPNLERWTVSPGTKLEDVAKNLLRNPNVRFAEPDYFVTKSVVPNDTYYTSGSLWGMYGAGTSTVNLFGSRAGDAWAAGYTGSSDIYVGIIDEGVQYTHPDLAANMWVNTAEISDGIDNDGNGYIDDVNGWDFFNNDNSVFDAGGDDHGTHVAGTIGGVGGNGIGVVGVNWNVKMIPAKFLGPSGGYLSDAILAMDYLTDLKTRKNINLVAVNNSWGGGDYTQSMADAIDRMGDAGILFIAAAGNEATDTDAGSHYPSRYECTKGGTRGWDCVVSVAAIDSTGALAYFSNWGNNSVDLGAPGVSINSTVSVDSYAAYSGTSMATPHVTGAVALCASANPTLAPRLIREALLGSARATTSLAGKTVTGARLDANALVSACRPQAAAPSGSASGLAATATGISHASLAWTDGITGETGYEVQTALGTVAACGQFGLGVIIPAGATSFGASGLQPGTDYCFRVRGVNNFSGGSSSAWSAIASAKTLPAPAPYSCAATTYSWLDAVTGGTSYALADDGSVLVTLPFTVNSYGASYTQARIAANGFLRLGSGTATQFLNQPIPLIDDTNGMIAVAWDDWNPAGGGRIWAKTLGTAPNRTYVVSWVGIPNFNVSGSAATFQVAISEGSGAVTLQ